MQQVTDSRPGPSRSAPPTALPLLGGVAVLMLIVVVAVVVVRLHYFTCSIEPSGQIAYSRGPWAPESIRLELAG